MSPIPLYHKDRTEIWINTIGIESKEKGQPLIVFEREYYGETFQIKNETQSYQIDNVVQSVDKGMFLYSGDAGQFVH